MKKALIVILLVFTTLQIWAQCEHSLRNFPDDKVMVVAHRGNWREAPENSVWAIKKAIESGANMAEIDLALTRDSVLILMHDKTINRTTTGKGRPQDFTLEEIKKLYLRDGAGHTTQMKVPTLEEILSVAKGKIFLNLDKGFNYIGLVYPLIKKYDMLNEVLFKGNVSYETFDKKYGNIKDEIVFMPIVRLEKGDSREKIEEYLDNYIPYGFEFTVGNDESMLIDFRPIRNKSIKVWVNSLWPHHNAGNNDDIALENPNVYSWYIKHNVNIIQTDRIKELTEYLRKNGLWKSN